MSFNNPGKKTYRSMNGVQVELDKLIMRNETTLAVGNVKVNARGDMLGPGGKIIKKHEETIAENAPTRDNVISQPPKPKKIVKNEQPVIDEKASQEVKTRSAKQSKDQTISEE